MLFQKCFKVILTVFKRFSMPPQHKIAQELFHFCRRTPTKKIGGNIGPQQSTWFMDDPFRHCYQKQNLRDKDMIVTTFIHIHSTAKYTLLEASTSGLRQNFPPFHMGYVTKIKTSGASHNIKIRNLERN